MARSDFSISGYAGALVRAASDVIGGVNHELAKIVWGDDGEALNVSRTSPLPTTPPLCTIFSIGHGSISGASALPDLPDVNERVGMYASLIVESGSIRWGIDPETVSGSVGIPVSTSVELNLGTQLVDVKLYGTAALHVVYYYAGEVA